MNEFEADLKINLDELHIDWRDQPAKRYKYACEVSYLDKALNKLVEKISVTKATLIKECKQENPKFTVQQIDGYCAENPDFAGMKDEQINAMYDLNMAKNALKAFDDLKMALENEVKLWKGDYFSTPIEEKETGKISIREKSLDEATKKTRRILNTKKKEK